MTLGAARPTNASNVSDRILAGEELSVLEPPIHDAIDSVHLIAEALDRVRQLLGRIVSKVVRLAGFGAEIGHLPEQPLVDFDATALVLRIELSGLAAEILQNCAGLEDRDRLAVRAIIIDDRQHAIVGRDCQEVRLELIALGNIDRDHRVRKCALLEHDRDLPAVRSGPVIEIDGFFAACGQRRFDRLWRGSHLAPALLLLLSGAGHEHLPRAGMQALFRSAAENPQPTQVPIFGELGQAPPGSTDACVMPANRTSRTGKPRRVRSVPGAAMAA